MYGVKVCAHLRGAASGRGRRHRRPAAGAGAPPSGCRPAPPPRACAAAGFRIQTTNPHAFMFCCRRWCSACRLSPSAAAAAGLHDSRMQDLTSKPNRVYSRFTRAAGTVGPHAGGSSRSMKAWSAKQFRAAAGNKTVAKCRTRGRRGWAGGPGARRSRRHTPPPAAAGPVE